MNIRYRDLTPSEIEQLELAGNCAEDWSAVKVADPFCADCLRGNTFDGQVRLGPVERRRVTRGGLRLFCLLYFYFFDFEYFLQE